MRKSGGAGKKKQVPDAIDEVEELLKLTQDDLLLKLTVNSHIKSKSNSDFIPESSHTNAIDSDLDRRFQALRSKPSNPNPTSGTTTDHEDVDNLFARFAVLKANSNGTDASNSSSEQQAKIVMEDEDEDEEDEVEKIINWAKDAARLDPSPSSDFDDDDDDDEDDDSDDDSDDGASRRVDRKKKGSKK